MAREPNFKVPDPGRVCVFTALFQDRDYLREIPRRFIEQGVDYFCFTDDESLRSDTYRVIYVGPVADGRLEARRWKMLMPHPLLRQGYDYHIWLDASVVVRSRLTAMLQYMQLADADIQAFAYVGKRQPWSGLLSRRASPRMDRFNEIWFEETVAVGEHNHGEIRDEFVFFESLERAKLRLNLLPITALPFWAFSTHHKGRSWHPGLEKRVLSGWLPLNGLPAVACEFVLSLLFARGKIQLVQRHLSKGWTPR